MTALDGPLDAATETFDGVDSPRFFVRGRGGLGQPRVHVYAGDRSRVVVGNFVTIADDVDLVVGGNHRTDWVTTYPIQEMYDLPDAYVDSVWSNGDTHIDHGAAIGRGAKVMPGAHIGVAAHVLPFAVVTRDVAAGAIVVGSPAREVGRRFDQPVIDALCAVDWDAPEPDVAAQIGRATGADAHDVVPALGEPLDPVVGTALEPSVPTRRTAPWRARIRAAVTVRRDRLDRRPANRAGNGSDRTVRGRASYGRPTIHARTGAPGRVAIGRFCSIAKNCEVLLDPGASCRSSRHAGRGADVIVGNDVWLGMGVKVYPGVTIADGAVAAAWSVVVDDVPPYAIVAGNPARVVRTRFDESTIAALLRIRWWDWPDHEIVANWRALCSDDLATFVAEHDPAPVELDPADAPDLLYRSASP